MGWGEEISTLDWKARALNAEAELERIRPLIGMHDPTGADHMEEMMVVVARAEKAEAELQQFMSEHGSCFRLDFHFTEIIPNLEEDDAST